MPVLLTDDFWNTRSGLVVAGALITFTTFLLAFMILICLLKFHYVKYHNHNQSHTVHLATSQTLPFMTETSSPFSHSDQILPYDISPPTYAEVAMLS